ESQRISSRFERDDVVSKARRRSRISTASARRSSDVFATPAARRTDHRQYLAPRQGIGAEHAEHPAGHHADPGFVHAARRHALMGSFDDDGDALRLQYLVDRVGGLRRHLLLALTPIGVSLDK